MKRKIISITLAIVCITTMVLTITGCGKPSLNGSWENNEGYVVTFNEATGTVVVSINESRMSSADKDTYRTVYLIKPDVFEGTYVVEKNQITANVLATTLYFRRDGDTLVSGSSVYTKVK